MPESTGSETEIWSVTDSTIPVAKRIIAGIVLLGFVPMFLTVSLIFMGVFLVQVVLGRGEFRDGTWQKSA